MRVLITGASEGIGGATARLLAERAAAHGKPCSLVLTTSGRNGPPEALIADLGKAHATVHHIPGDLGDADFCRALARETLVRLGGLDTLVSNAGAVAPARLEALNDAAWSRLMDVNVRATAILGREVKAALSAARGSIVAVGSTSGLFPHVGHGAYSPAKAALTMLIRQMAQEWAPDGIRANLVAPGLINTPMTANLYANPAIRTAREAVVPIGRIGTPHDVAEVIAFLAGPAAAYVTGETIRVDGGLADSALSHIPSLPD